MKRYNVGLIAILVVSQSFCSESKNTSSRGTDAGATSATFGGSISGTLVISEGAPATSVANAEVTVQNHPEIVGTTDADGSFVLNNVLPGTLNVLVTSSDGSTGLAEKPPEYAKIFQDVVVRNAETNGLGSHEFKKSGTLTGKVTFFENTNNLDLTGSDVYIPGTSYIAKTDDKGAFTLAGLPEGTLTLKAQHSGYAILSLEVEVKSGEIVDLGELPLSLSNGPEGGLAIQSDVTPTIAGQVEKLILGRTATLKINYDKNSSLMKISDEPSFLNRNWIPVATTYDWLFTSDGPKKLYVMFSDLNGLESSPYSDTVIVDTEAPTLTSIQILNGWEQSAKQTVYIDVKTADSGSGVASVIFSNSSGVFSDTNAQTYHPRMDWSLSATDGAKIVYAKVRDYAGRESTVVQDNINLATSGRTIIYATTYDEDITLKKAQSPFWIKSGSDAFIFKGRFTVEPGATVYVDNSLTVKFNGLVSLVGTASEPIIIRSVGLFTGSCTMTVYGASLLFNGAPPGVTANSVIRYTQFKSIAELRFNGGLLEHNTFDGSGCTDATAGKMYKSGLDNLIVRNNSFVTWNQGLDVTEGNGNTSFTNNTGTFTTGVAQSGTASNTLVTGNQFASDTLSGLYGALLVWNNDNDFVGYANNTLSGPGTALHVANRTTDLIITGVTITGCYRPLVVMASRTITLSNSTINCQYGDDSTSAASATIVYNQNTITVSKSLIITSYTSPTLQYTANKLSIDCGTTAGTYCDILYAKGRECGVSASGNGGSYCSSTPQCTAYNSVTASLSGNNVFCKGNASSGCRGLTLHLAPDSANTEADEAVTCDFTTGNALQISLNNNYWDNGAGYKTIANGTNLQTSVVTDNGYTASTSGTVTGLSSTAITANSLMPIGGQTITFTSWPTSVTTSAFNTSAPP